MSGSKKRFGTSSGKSWPAPWTAQKAISRGGDNLFHAHPLRAAIDCQEIIHVRLLRSYK